MRQTTRFPRMGGQSLRTSGQPDDWAMGHSAGVATQFYPQKQRTLETEQRVYQYLAPKSQTMPVVFRCKSQTGMAGGRGRKESRPMAAHYANPSVRTTGQTRYVFPCAGGYYSNLYCGQAQAFPHTARVRTFAEFPRYIPIRRQRCTGLQAVRQ